MHELNHLLEIDNQGLEVKKDGDALNNNIAEWFDNPMHTIADNPGWGHNLTPFQFISQTENDAVMIEMAIIEKLPLDVRGLNIDAIRVTFPSLDLFNVTIVHQFGNTTLNLPLK